MSTAEEIVENEIAAQMGDDEPVGAQEPEPEPAPDPEPDESEAAESEPPEPPSEEEQAQAAALSQRDIERRIKACEKATTAYVAKVETIMGGDFQQLVPVPLSTGFLIGFAWNPEFQPLDEDQVAATKQLIGVYDGPKYEQAPDARECPRCNGWGTLTTGSKVTGQQTIKCAVCKGRGWEGEAANIAPADVLKLATVVNMETGEITEAPADEDEFGTPRGHPDYGKMLQYRSPNWRGELDAWKAGQPAPLA